MSDLPSPCGDWRVTVRRLGAVPVPTHEIGALARLDADGTVTVFADGQAGPPGLGGWRSAGPGRVVLVVEWLVRGPTGRAIGRLSVRAAAELSADGRTCQARLTWRQVDLTGSPQGSVVTAEADGTHLAP